MKIVHHQNSNLSTIRVGQNYINKYGVHMVFWQGNNQIYGHIQCLYTILANSIYNSQASGINGSMLQFAVGFVIYTKAWREIKNQKWAAGPHKSKTMQRSKCQVHKSDTSELRWEHPQDKAHKLRVGGGKNNPIKSKA
jgi:hypothetical protein